MGDEEQGWGCFRGSLSDDLDSATIARPSKSQTARHTNPDWSCEAYKIHFFHP